VAVQKWSVHKCQKHVALLVNVTVGVYVHEKLVEGKHTT